MVRFPEAQARVIKGIFVCKRCKRKTRTSMMRVLLGKIKCRNCNGKSFRPMRKK